MKKVICALLAAMTLVLGSASMGSAWGGRGGHGGHHFGHRHGVVGARIFLGPVFWWGPAYPYYYYAAPPVVVEEQPPVVIRQQPAYVPPGAQAEQYWYYCQNAQAYYPYVKECPGGWMQVVPQPTPPDR
jgi:hypothetical protein